MTRFAGPYEPLWTSISPSLNTRYIDCLLFSPTTEFLAAGSSEGEIGTEAHGLVTVWKVEDGVKLGEMQTKSPVRSMLWHPDWRSVVILGCSNGDAFAWNFRRDGPSSPILLGSKAPVLTLAFNSPTQYLAAGVGGEVHVAKPLLPTGNHATFALLPEPPGILAQQSGEDQRIRATGLHFLRRGESLVVSYLRHGIVCWDIQTITKLWAIKPVHPLHYIGSSALSPDEKTIAITNSVDGVDLYPLLPEAKPFQSLRYGMPDPASNRPMTVAYMHTGLAIVCGSPSGNVCIWDISTGDVVQTLSHEGATVQVVSSALTKYEAFLATSKPFQEEKSAVIIMWRASIDTSHKRSFSGNIVLQMKHAIGRWRQWFDSQSDIVAPWIYTHPFWSVLVALVAFTIPLYLIWSPNISVLYDIIAVLHPFLVHMGQAMNELLKPLTEVIARSMRLLSALARAKRLAAKKWILSRLQDLLQRLLQEDALA